MNYELPESISLDQINAAFDKIIVHRIKPTKSKGGIILTESAQDYMSDNIGIITSIGPSVDESLEVGMIVMFGKHAGTWEKIPNSDEEYFVCLDVDVMAIINRE